LKQQKRHKIKKKQFREQYLQKTRLKTNNFQKKHAIRKFSKKLASPQKNKPRPKSAENRKGWQRCCTT